MKWLIAILLVFVGLLLVVSIGLFCLQLDWDPVPSEGEVVGFYAGTFKGYVDQFELTSDHKFNQILETPNGETMRSSGTWALTNRELEIDGYISFINMSSDVPLEKPVKCGSFSFAAYRGSLVADWGSAFHRLDKKNLPEHASGDNVRQSR